MATSPSEFPVAGAVALGDPGVLQSQLLQALGELDLLLHRYLGDPRIVEPGDLGHARVVGQDVVGVRGRHLGEGDGTAGGVLEGLLSQVVGAGEGHPPLDEDPDPGPGRRRFLDGLDVALAHVEAQVPARLDIDLGRVGALFAAPLDQLFGDRFDVHCSSFLRLGGPASRRR